jgi:hypothetical protein
MKLATDEIEITERTKIKFGCYSINVIVSQDIPKDCVVFVNEKGEIVGRIIPKGKGGGDE